MPKGGFGNLIALPLQKVPRESGFTEFLDDELRPHADQWSYLASIQRVSHSQTERLIAEALHQGDLIGVRIACMDDDDQPDPWTLPPSRKRPDKPIKGPLPSSVEIVRSNLLFIDKRALPPEMLDRLLRIAAFQNPEFYEAQAMRLSTFDKPRVIACGEDLPGHVGSVPSRRAAPAGTGRSKKNQMCAPLPERERSNTAGTSSSRQVERNADVSSFHVFLSKSTARNQQVSFSSSGYTPRVCFPVRWA